MVYFLSVLPTDLVNADGLYNGRDEHDERNRKTLHMAWTLAWLKPSFLIDRNIDQ